MFNKKAISPVVGTALLLVVAVISVVGFQGWFDDFSSSMFTDIEKDTSKINSLKVEYIDTNTLYLNSNSKFKLNTLIISDKNNIVKCKLSDNQIINSSGLVGHWKLNHTS